MSNDNTSNDNNRELLEEYKELGLQFRHYASEITSTNRLMLPPLVIGLLVLYGEVEKFLSVEIKNPQAVYGLVWFGCFIISLFWAFNVSRLAQLIQVTLHTLIENEEELGLKGHTSVDKMDGQIGWHIPYSKILKYPVLRLFGFWIYFCLLISFFLKSWNFNEILPLLNLINFNGAYILQLFGIALSGLLSVWIWSFYFNFNELFNLRWRFSPKLRFSVKFLQVLPAIIIIIIIFFFLLLFPVDEQLQSDANAYLASGLEYSAKGNYKLAIEGFSIAITLDPNNPGAYFNRGSAYYKKREFANAIVDLDKAIALDPHNQSARNLRDAAQRRLEN